MSEAMPLKISEFLKKRIDGYTFKPVSYNYGVVTAVGDGVVRIAGLDGRKYGELLEFEGGIFGMALDLREDGLGAVLMDRAESVSVGDRVKGTNAVAEIGVGNDLLGRVVDSIGRPLDGMPLNPTEFLPAERNAPSIIERKPVNKPLQTGILAIDSMIPIGCGQRELIIGDRQTGKTTIAVDTILNQKGKDVVCVYCAIGQKASNIAGIVEIFKKEGAMDYCVVVASTASDSPAMQYLTPYAACSVAEYFMQQGRDALIVYDDLSKHAVAYRTMSLLLLRPPGREAYPGDVFYLHSRLLERSASLADTLGGGSLTALPIIETTGGNISAYIPTNVISITDGQIFLESDLFHSGIRPAVNTGLSVSRVGRSAQYDAMKKVSGTLRIELSQYREMAVFSRFGSDVDDATKQMLLKGQSLTQLLVQNKGVHYSLCDEVALLLADKYGLFFEIGETELNSRIFEFLNTIHTSFADMCDGINENKTFSDSDEQIIKDVVDKIKVNRV